MLSIMVTIPVAIFVPYSILSDFIIPVFGGAFVLTILGIVVLIMYGTTAGSLIMHMRYSSV